MLRLLFDYKCHEESNGVFRFEIGLILTELWTKTSLGAQTDVSEDSCSCGRFIHFMFEWSGSLTEGLHATKR